MKGPIVMRRLWAILIAALLLVPVHAQVPPPPMTLESACSLALEKHPKLQQAILAIEAARGRAVQAGLYPNPQMQMFGDELSDKAGPPGIWTFPYVTQEIVVGQKNKLSKAAADREVDQATLAVATQRFALLTSVRQAYFDVLAAQRRVEMLEWLAKVSDRTAPQGYVEPPKDENAFDNAQIDFERDKNRADLESARREVPAAYRRLAAAIGVPDMSGVPITGTLDAMPPVYSLDQTIQYVRCVSPELQSAKLGIDRSRLLLARAEAEKKPNVTVGANFVHQSQNKSNDWGVSLQMPMMMWNRNQGSIQAAQAQLGDAIHEVSRVDADLVDRVAAAMRDYESAKQKVIYYHDVVLPRAQQMLNAAQETYKASKLEYSKVFEGRRGAGQAAVDYAKAEADLWKAAATIAGLTMEDPWPPPPAHPIGAVVGIAK